MSNIRESFESMVFNEKIMREKLPYNIYKSLKKIVSNREFLNIEIADIVANAMKLWAVDNGVTHFTHWFQPLNGITAEKHDSFISCVDNRGIIIEFSGKELIKGEPDASSFPSGGLRSTFEARGYTAWDPTSNVFIKDNVLCIPSVFFSYTGESLDKKMPLLKSIELINEQSLRILKLFGNDTVKRVDTVVGAEQEYFLIDKKYYNKRKDLKLTGRTLFGARCLKEQEMSQNYFGFISPRVHAYMEDLDLELWKLGILSNTRHNEVAPSQHELVPIYTNTNIATDNNQLIMEMMKKVALKHNFICLLHEKPFEYVNGSGKHNNWSMITDTGVNLLEPGNLREENMQFLLLLTAVIKAVDEYQDLLRVSVVGAGNDYRLGNDEAPPAIVSVYLGDKITNILESIIKGNKLDKKECNDAKICFGRMFQMPKDMSDRNRTSPFAFTGNKFEFRMVGSSASIADASIIINTIIGEVLSQFADILEKAKNFEDEVIKLIKFTLIKNYRVIFNGNNYSKEWIKEAEERGLLNLKKTSDALPYLTLPKNIELFTKHNIFTETEIKSRQEILYDIYCKKIHLEALTMVDMVMKDIIPSVFRYVGM